MKIEDTQEVGFKPFSITIESLEEARRLWWYMRIHKADMEKIVTNFDDHEDPAVGVPKDLSNIPEWSSLTEYMKSKGYK